MQTQPCVLIGVGGGIAAYKACEIVRGLQKAGLRVKVMMSEHATHFIDPLTFRSLTHEPVAVGLFDNPADPIHHISLAQEADLVVLAPCTANIMAKVATGIADDLLTTTVLATCAPVLIAPAMNVHMYENAATQANMNTLRQRGFYFAEADAGYLACGDVGKGRLAEPETIVSAALALLAKQGLKPAVSDNEEAPAKMTPKNSCAAKHADLSGKNILITAGPTCEPIDPVRYLTNRSSGKFGYALAQAALERGAKVTLISGPVALSAPAGATMRYVETAQEMLDAALMAFPTCDIALCAAAVADMRPTKSADHKLKKGTDDEALLTLPLTPNPDILASLARSKKNQVVVGFAAETNDVVANAKKKLERKGADIIVANEVGAKKTFGEEDDTIWLITEKDESEPLSASKKVLAHHILDAALALATQR